MAKINRYDFQIENGKLQIGLRRKNFINEVYNRSSKTYLFPFKENRLQKKFGREAPQYLDIKKNGYKAVSVCTSYVRVILTRCDDVKRSPEK